MLAPTFKANRSKPNMILELQRDLTPEKKSELLLKLRALGWEYRELPPTDVQRIGILDETVHDEEACRRLPGVVRVLAVRSPYKLASREMHPADTLVRVGDVVIGGRRIVVIAGPCAVESREQALSIARRVQQDGAALFRGGVFKPRTSPYRFRDSERKACGFWPRCGRRLASPW